MKNTKRKSIMLTEQCMELLQTLSQGTNLTASEVVNELLQMYWSRWLSHRLKRFQPYIKKEPSPTEKRESPKLDAEDPSPHQDSNTRDYDKELLEEEYRKGMEDLYGPNWEGEDPK